MALFKKMSEKLRLLLMLIVAVSILWVPVWAVINRITGSNIIDGNGLRFGTAVGGKDSLVTLLGYTMLIDNDSIEIDTTNLIAILDNTFATPTEASGLIQDSMWTLHDLWKADINDSLYTLPALWQGDIGDSIAAHWAVFIAGTDPGIQIHDSLNVHWADFMHDADLADIQDSLWKQSFLPLTRSLSISEETDDSVSIIYPLRSGVISWAVKHINESGAAANQLDTVVFSFLLPAGVPDVDSITFNLRTSSADTAVSGLRIRAFKQTAELGSKTALTAALIGYFTVTDAWEHKTIAGASIGAIAGGNELSIEMCVQTDVAAVVWHDEPKVWCIHR